MKKVMLLLAALCTFGALAAAQDDVDADAKYATEMLRRGARIPALVMNDPSGVSHDLKDFRGKYVVLDFWASWCKDCRAEMPAVKELYDAYAPRGIEFLGVSFDTDLHALIEYGLEADIPWMVVCNQIKTKENPIYAAYGLHWIPTMFLVSPEGKILGYAFTAEDMEELLERTLPA